MTRCLIIDDVEVTRFTTNEILSQLQIETKTAGDVSSAVQLLKEIRFDVVLLDLHLGRDSGMDLLKKMREELRLAMPVVVFSAVENQDKHDEIISAGAADFLVKPTTKEKIEASFKKLGFLDNLE